MKTLGWAAVMALGLSGAAFAEGATDPTLLTDGQLDLIVGGKKPQGIGNGNGTDTNLDEDQNLVYQYYHAKKDDEVLLDYDTGGSTNKHYSNCMVGIINSSGEFAPLLDPTC